MASILNVDQINNAAGTSGLTLDASTGKASFPNGATLPAGSVIQVQYRAVANNGFTTTSASMTDITNWYVDITPKFSNSILVWQTTITLLLNDGDGYGRFRIVDSNNGDAQWSSNSYMGSSSYNQPVNTMIDYPFLHANTAGTTSSMRLQFQAQVNSGGTLHNAWSNGDNRIIMVTEIAQ